MSSASAVMHSVSVKEMQTEAIRKSIHMMVAFVPAFARYNIFLTFSVLAFGTLIYSYSEFMRLRGVEIPFIGSVTAAASRSRDNGFIFGPVTLALGVMMALMLYPEPAAAIAIYALAFGDGFSSLFGKFYGRKTIPFTGGKTFAGSTACLVSVFLITLAVSGSIRIAVFIAISTTVLESIPSGDLDNMIIPVGSGLLATLLI